MQLGSDLSNIDFNADSSDVSVSYGDDLGEYLAKACLLLNEPLEATTYQLDLSDNANALRWFWLPQELAIIA
jgi:hypothetical protein